MRSYAMARKVDALGRVVLPADLRRLLAIEEGDVLGIQVEQDRIVLTKIAAVCLFCGDDEALTTYRDRPVCKPCLDNLKKI